VHLVGEGQQHENRDGASRPPPCFRRVQKVLQESDLLVHDAIVPFVAIAGKEDPGQGDVLELAQVAKIVVDGEIALTHPAQGFAEPTLGQPDLRFHRSNRPHIWKKVTHIPVLCLVEEIERADQISLSLQYSSFCDAPTMRVLREPGMFTQLRASQ